MIWESNIKPDHYQGFLHVWYSKFGNHYFQITRQRSFKYHVWCHDIISETRWFLWSAKRAALIAAIEHCLYSLAQIEDRIGELEDLTARSEKASFEAAQKE